MVSKVTTSRKAALISMTPCQIRRFSVGKPGYSQKKPCVQMIGVMREDGNYVPGVRTRSLLRLIRFDWKAHVNHIERIETEAAYGLSLRLNRKGIVAGPSAGFALAGLLQYLDGRKNDGTLNELREENGEIPFVFICPDSPIPYLEEYLKYLDESDFPQVSNEELVLNKPG